MSMQNHQWKECNAKPRNVNELDELEIELWSESFQLASDHNSKQDQQQTIESKDTFSVGVIKPTHSNVQVVFVIQTK